MTDVPEVVERVALALACEAHDDDVRPGSDLHWGYMDAARAAIEALRDYLDEQATACSNLGRPRSDNEFGRAADIITLALGKDT